MQEAMQEATRAKLPGHSFPPTPRTNVVGRPHRRPQGPVPVYMSCVLRCACPLCMVSSVGTSLLKRCSARALHPGTIAAHRLQENHFFHISPTARWDTKRFPAYAWRTPRSNIFINWHPSEVVNIWYHSTLNLDRISPFGLRIYTPTFPMKIQ